MAGLDACVDLTAPPFAYDWSLELDRSRECRVVDVSGAAL